MDLNDLRVFASVGSLLSFTDAARTLGLPKSSVSRSVAHLEADLGVRLCHRTTREVVLTEAGAALLRRSREIMGQVEETRDFFATLAGAPQGTLRISAGIGFGVNVLSDVVPKFLALHPELKIDLDLCSRLADLVAERVDVAIRMGPMPDSTIVAVRLGAMSRYLCAAPGYLEQHGAPGSLEDIATHDLVEMPGQEGRRRTWTFTRNGESKVVEIAPRVLVNDALTVYRMIQNGGGLGIVSGYLCGPDIASGRLVRLFPAWSLEPVEVNAVFPSRRDMAPAVRAFVDFMKASSKPGAAWLDDPLGG